jgi:hypothetical protein
MSQALRSPEVLHIEDFSLALGGPLYQLYLRSHLARAPLDLLRRRVIVISLICWFPLLLLSVLQGNAFHGVSVPFLSDIEVHIRFLVCIPLLVIAELIVHKRLVLVVEQFIDRNIVNLEDRARFSEIIASTMRMRNSVLFEIVLLALCFTAGDWVWKQGLSLEGSSWYSARFAGEMHLTAAGYWYEFLALPIFRFLVLRWYFRLFLWYLFLWRVRALPLHLNLFHPDRAGGLGFLAGSLFAFGAVLVAHTAFLAGFIGNRIWHAGAALTDFKMEIAGALLFLLLLVLAPLTFFIVHLERARRIAGREYGILASQYVDEFRQKWTVHTSQTPEPLLGTPDLQSLADLGNAFTTISQMQLLPFGKHAVVRLVAWLVVPLLPLMLTVIPLRQIAELMLKFAL